MLGDGQVGLVAQDPVRDLPLTGNRCPSEEDKVPVPNARAIGSRCW